ncbi:MAG TPA: Ig-like domain-containing protein [Gemmatimonadales bacterium]|nr:Ig-like domain-containing protein [Gemmatimonadales bacterium]
MSGRTGAAGALLLALIACAKMGPPAGGAPDKVPPKLVATTPESVGVYPGWKNDVEFRFDEIVSEGSSPNFGLGTGDLEKLILLSPSGKVPVIKWHRDRITVRPREGWQPNRVYRVELLPGLVDLRRNKLDTTAVLTFSTGGELPTDTLRGIAIDWVQGRVAIGALVELILQPDSLVYRAVTDSGGRFTVGPLPGGEYLVYAVIDQNHDQRRGRRESYDSAVVAAGKPVPALWLIPRDTVGPRITQVAPGDSVSAVIGFGGPLAPDQRFDSSNVSLRRQSDSAPVPFRSVLVKELDDSLQRLARARADSLRIAADTTIPDSLKFRPARPLAPKAPAPALPGAPRVRVDVVAESILKSRPKLAQSLVLRVDSAFVPETKYLVEFRGIRSAAGVAGDAKGVLVIPKRPPPPPVDTTRADSTRKPNIPGKGLPADSLRPGKPTKPVKPKSSP